MAHKIAEAIIEDGNLKYIDKKLPPGKIRVHIIYDAIEEKTPSETDISKIAREASGIYKDIDVEMESNKLRISWERNVHN
ncbi:MAG: hypothetical protein U9P49_04660 [Thermodesulfobacteriota bacterium]|nr:hypothetical protein [Thermodesulfobacteriota bacterium]